jgi:nifR3 family TIM-barrel protein
MAPLLSLPPIRLGSVAVDFPVALAALSGYSDWPTRVIARRMGAGYTIGEVLLDQFVINVSKGSKARRYIRVTSEDHPAAAQLMGSTAEAFGPAALKLVQAGFDAIDVNFGCPVRKVVGKCRGGYLLSQPEAALEVLARVREVVPPDVPVTLKMRRGMDDGDQSRENFLRIFDGAFALGIAAVTVHGRTVRQRYDGRSSWDFLRELKDHAGDRIVWGSGDLFTAEDCLAMIAQTRVDGITVARGAIGNPWIFRDLRALAAGRPLPDPPSLFEQRETIAEHYRLAEELYGAKRASYVMAKFGIKYSRLHPQARQVRDAFVAAHRLQQWRLVLDEWYAEDLPGVRPTGPLDGDAVGSAVPCEP